MKLSCEGIFWLTITLNETYEREVKVPVQMVGIPKNVVLTSPAVDTVRVTIRDKGWMIVAYMYGERLPIVSLNFKNFDRGSGGGIISASDIKRLLDQQLEISTTVTSVKPDRLEFFYNNGERKRVPVRGRIACSSALKAGSGLAANSPRNCLHTICQSDSASHPTCSSP